MTKKIAKLQESRTVEIVPRKSEPRIKCLTVMVFEENGKTIIQPLVTRRDAQDVQELLQKNILEVWLSNGLSDHEQFDVSILKYKLEVQPSKTCSRTEHRVCLKNYFETIVSCEQCFLDIEGAKK